MSNSNMIPPEVDIELGRLVGLLFEGKPYPLRPRAARLAELQRRAAVRAHMIDVARSVSTAAELLHALSEDGTLEGLG